jgi:hypothetical protein
LAIGIGWCRTGRPEGSAAGIGGKPVIGRGEQGMGPVACQSIRFGERWRIGAANN